MRLRLLGRPRSEPPDRLRHSDLLSASESRLAPRNGPKPLNLGRIPLHVWKGRVAGGINALILWFRPSIGCAGLTDPFRKLGSRRYRSRPAYRPAKRRRT